MGQTYLKKIDSDLIEEYANSLINTSYETKVLTSTAAIFNKSGINNYVQSILGDNSRIDFVIYATETDELIGDLSLNDIDRRNMNCNIRIAIDSGTNYGKGYGQEAMKLAMNYGFGMFNLHRIELDVLSANARAIHVYGKLGFKEEGVKKESCYYNHRYHDMTIMSCLRADFLKLYPDCLMDDVLAK